MKNFEKPFCEVVKFNGGVIATSGCSCWDGYVDDGPGADCTLDGVPQCTCDPNYDDPSKNCITPGT